LLACSGLAVGCGDRLGFRRAALAQADAEQRHRTDHKELALPVLKRLEPELRGGQEPTNRNRLLAVGQLFLVELGRAPAAWTAKQARKIANKTSANECSYPLTPTSTPDPVAPVVALPVVLAGCWLVRFGLLCERLGV
jgi:hypothetical protein